MKNKRLLIFFFIIYGLSTLAFFYYTINSLLPYISFYTNRTLLHNTHEITLVGDNSFPPFSYTDASGNVTGYEADLVKALAEKLDIKINYRQMNWSDALEELSAGKIAGITGMTVTKERAQKLYFTRPYQKTSYATVVRTGSDIKSLLQSPTLSIAAQKGSFTSDFAKKYAHDGAAFFFITEPKEAIELLNSKQVDIWVENLQVARFELHKNTQAKDLELQAIPGSYEDYAMVFGPKHRYLVSVFNNALRSLQMDKTLAELDIKWFTVTSIRGSKADTGLFLTALLFFPLTIVLFSLIWNHSLQAKVIEKTEQHRLAEISLTAEKERLAVTLASIGDGVITTDIKGRVTMLNKVAEHLTGWSLDKAFNRQMENIFCIINQDSREPVPNPVEQVLSTGQSVSLTSQTLLIARDGSERPIADSAAPILNNEKKLIGAVLVFRDVTQEQEAKEQLKKSEEFANSVINSLSVKITVLDPEGRIIATNQRWKQYVSGNNSSPTSFDVGSSYMEVCQNLLGIPKEDVFTIMEGVARVSKGLDREYSMEYSCNLHGKKRWFYVKITPMSDALPGQVVVTHTDITDTKLAEQALRKGEEKYRITFENTGTAMMILNEDGTLSIFNEHLQDLLGYRPEELKEAYFSSFVCPEERELVQYYHQLRRMNPEAVPHQYEFTVIDKNGSRKVVLASMNMIPGTTQSVGSLLEITDRKNMEEKLRTNKNKIEKLHQIALEMGRCQDEHAVYQLIIQAAQSILHFIVCNVSIVEGEELISVARSSSIPIEGRKRSPITEGLAGLTYRTRETHLIKDVSTCSIAKPIIEHIKSAISAPIGDIGVFQAISTELNGFDEDDVELTELLLSHALEALKRIRSEEKIRYLSFHDSLTTLYNRAFFDEELKRLDTKRQMPLSLIMGDINDLKLVNDVFGHQKGDELITIIADILKHSCRTEDVVARWGGDEFIVLLPKTEERYAQEICSRIRKSCKEANFAPIQPSIALGAASKEDPFADINEVLKEAENRMYRNKLAESKSARSSVITSLEKTLWEKSIETREHASRMQKMAVRIGRQLDLTASQLDDVKLLATLHDIGKIAIPEEIINKPGRLTDEEWENVKRHPEIGFRIAEASPELGLIAKAILAHHEWWNGKGYPQGLKGMEIPLISRIISIVDAYDVMTNGRPYKKALTKDEALAEIKRCAGTQFDPVLVELFIKIMAELDVNSEAAATNEE